MAFELTILGCGSATPTSTKHPTAQLLKMAERFFLIDCGEGTQQQLRKYKLNMGKISHVFVSHLHGDHYFGLIGLISSFHLMNRDKELHIYGPAGLKKIVEVQLEASNTRLVYPLFFHETQTDNEEIIFEDKRLSVKSFPLKHSVPVTGFLFEEKEGERRMMKDKIAEYQIPVYDIRRIKKGADFIGEDGEVIKNKDLTIAPPQPLRYAFCTDTAYMEKTAQFVKGVDVLYHESTFLKEDIKRARKTKHSTAQQAAKVAVEAGARKLLLGHYSARYDDYEVFEEEAQEIFSDVTGTAEGMRIIASSNEIVVE